MSEDDQLGNRILEKDMRALSRSLSLVENGSPKSDKIIETVYPHIGRSHIIGITGPPGSGKSTLINLLIKKYLEKGLSIAVLAIDPTSPFTGGAILGDRIRMLDYSLDPNVFIRSMASRGRVGGLSSSTFEAICLLDAYGFDKIIIETVGAGQNEIDIYQNCDTTVVVTVPGLGDDIQSIKAGIYEIPDLFVVNKSDLSGSNELKVQLQMMLDLHNSNTSWRIPVLLTSSTIDSGFTEFMNQIDLHYEFLRNSAEISKRREKRLKSEIIFKLHSLVLKKFENKQISLDTEIISLVNRRLPPNKIAKILLDKIEE